MTTVETRCFTCLKTDRKKFVGLNQLDIDEIPYLEKLKVCVTTDLIEIEDMEICWVCVKQLRICYSFRNTVQQSQQFLLQNLKVDELYDTQAESNGSHDTTGEPESEINDRIKEEVEEEHICEHCSAKFDKSWKLQKHLTRIHHQSRTYVCSECQKEFKQPFHLKEHMTSHTGEKNYSCPICDKQFQRLSSQRRHMRSHDAAPGQKTKRTPFLCTICGKSFPFSNGVQRHMRTHFNIRNFECSYCKKRFAQSTHLHVHLRTHTGEKPYVCDVCGLKFSLKSCLSKHVNGHNNAKAIGKKRGFNVKFVNEYKKEEVNQYEIITGGFNVKCENVYTGFM